ncbi:MAG TPA: hypothetical protein VEK33_07140 [Terriglobales bacterium]|nr:hypothetical protein [Terriglobales bacterium]
MMDLDEMKQRWTEHDRKLDQSIRLNQQLLTATNLNRARSALQRLTLFLSLGAVVWLAIVVALGNFIYQHVPGWRLALPAVLSGLFAIAMLAVTVAQITRIRQIDYGKPVAIIQRHLGGLRVLRIRTVQWGLLAGTVVWAPFLMVVAEAFFGVEDLSAPWFWAWLWANVAFGLSLVPLALWLSKKFSDRMEQFPFVQRLMHDIAGRSLNEATNFLGAVTAFERE